MQSPSYRHIDVEHKGDVVCVNFKDMQLDDSAIRDASREIEDLVLREKHCKVVVSLCDITCLYSVLVAKLIKLRQLLTQANGALKLCDLRPEIREVFESCQLQNYFDVAPDLDTAVDGLGQDRSTT